MPACRCAERNRPFKDDLPQGSNQRPRQWFVLKRNYSISAFNGYRREWSKTSAICCRACGSHWDTTSQRTVDRLEDSEKQAIYDLIDAIDGPITNDWSGESMTKEAAKKYVKEYGQST